MKKLSENLWFGKYEKEREREVDEERMKERETVGGKERGTVFLIFSLCDGVRSVFGDVNCEEMTGGGGSKWGEWGMSWKRETFPSVSLYQKSNKSLLRTICFWLNKYLMAKSELKKMKGNKFENMTLREKERQREGEGGRGGERGRERERERERESHFACDVCECFIVG